MAQLHEKDLIGRKSSKIALYLVERIVLGRNFNHKYVSYSNLI